jgi:predicted amidohydrolase
MKVRLIQFSPKLGNVPANLDYHIQQIEQAILDKIELIVFPELSISGYQLKDIVFDIALTPGHALISKIAALSKKIHIIIGAPYEAETGLIYNSALFFSRGKLNHVHHKTQLPNFGMFEEQMIFKAGNTFIPFDIDQFKAGILICREILFPMIAYLYFLQKTDLLIAISNSPFRGLTENGFSSFKFWENMGYTYSVFFHQNYLFVNRTGFEDGIGFGGGSFIAPAGQGISVLAPYFEEARLDSIICLDDVRRSRLQSNYLRDDKPEMILKELQRIVNAQY